MVFSLPPEPNTGVLKISSSTFTSRHGQCLLYSYTVHGCTTTLVRYLPWKYWLDDQMVSHTYARELKHRFNDVKRPWMGEVVIASVRPASSNNSVRAHKTIKSIPCFSDILSFYSDTFSFVDNRKHSLPKEKRQLCENLLWLLCDSSPQINLIWSNKHLFLLSLWQQLCQVWTKLDRRYLFKFK